MTEDDFFSNFDDDDGLPKGAAPKASAPRSTAPASFPQMKKAKEQRLPMSRGMIVTIICLAVSAAIGLAGGILAAVTRGNLDWIVWQFMIGIGGGAAATMLLGTVIYWLDEKNKLEYHYPVVLLLLAVNVANFALRCCFQEEYKIIFICLGFLIFGLSFFFCFHLIDPPWIVTMAIGAAFSLAFLISGWIMPDWDIWQWIIGGMVSLLLLAFIFVLERKGEFVCYSLSLIITVIVLAANFVLQRYFPDYYKIIFVWISAAAIVASTISVAFRHQKGDGAWGKVSIAPLAVGAVLLLLGLLLRQ